ncbi:MAG TPA: calcineurin, partial [Polyangiales bacterium]|nr:calcineurin [Polyangiales bacterium]
GNHEVMNVAGDFRYVTADGFRDYEGKEAAVHRELSQRAPADQRGRAAAFLPGEAVAKRLAKRPSILQLGENVFVHGGLLEQHVRYGIDRINREIQGWMAAPRLERAPEIAMTPNGPLWTRIYSDGAPAGSACDELGRVLRALSARRLIVGHTVQERGINSACDGRVWRIDVGLSRFYGKPASVLEIKGDSVRPINGPARP